MNQIEKQRYVVEHYGIAIAAIVFSYSDMHMRRIANENKWLIPKPATVRNHVAINVKANVLK